MQRRRLSYWSTLSALLVIESKDWNQSSVQVGAAHDSFTSPLNTKRGVNPCFATVGAASYIWDQDCFRKLLLDVITFHRALSMFSKKQPNKDILSVSYKR